MSIAFLVYIGDKYMGYFVEKICYEKKFDSTHIKV